MSFAFYADEQMTVLAGVATADGANMLEHTFNLSKPNDLMIKLYFGSPNPNLKLVTANNSGLDNIVLSVADALTDWQPEMAYKVGAVVEPADSAVQGAVYQCVQAGVSGSTPPIWLKTAGAVMQDGAAIWRCLGERHHLSEMRLALSEQDLDNAKGGLVLGTELMGGAAVAVYVRIRNAVQTPYLLASVPQLAIEINECMEVPKDG